MNVNSVTIACCYPENGVKVENYIDLFNWLIIINLRE